MVPSRDAFGLSERSLLVHHTGTKPGRDGSIASAKPLNNNGSNNVRRFP